MDIIIILIGFFAVCLHSYLELKEEKRQHEKTGHKWKEIKKTL